MVNSTDSVPAPAVQVSVEPSTGTPVHRLTCRGRWRERERERERWREGGREGRREGERERSVCFDQDLE